MSSLSRETIVKALEDVTDPATGQNVIAGGVVSGVVVRGGNIGFLINTTPENAARMESLRSECEKRVSNIAGVEKVTAVLTGENSAPPTPEKEKPALWNRVPVEGIKQIIAVASGKGGVGKSTATVCLALALQEKGLKVGILDADIYGPSIPLMLGISGQPEVAEGKMLPKHSQGLSCMSMGLLLGEQAAMMRAPMITKALNQMLRGTDWGELDVLLVDMPPGTGDVHLSLVQQAPLSGAIIVTTPQRVATLDAQKAVDMFRKTGVSVIGIVENISFMDANGAKIHPFGQGGGAKLAKRMETDFLGEIPLVPELREALDEGKTPVPFHAFSPVAEIILKRLSFRN